MSRVITDKEVLETESTKNEAVAPVNVFMFVEAMIGYLNFCFDLRNEDPDKKLQNHQNFVAYMLKLYEKVVVKGKEFKQSLASLHQTLEARDEDDSKEEEEGEEGKKEKEKGSSILKNYKGNVTELCIGDICWVAVIKGNANDKDVRPSMHNLEGKEGGLTVSVVTVKLFQACISIILAKSNLGKGLTPAPLCANIFRACKKSDAELWAIHGHSGLNFVANFVKKVSKRKGYENFPKLSDLLFVALRLDEGNQLKADKLKRKQPDYEPYPTVKAIIQSCQLSEPELDSYAKSVNPAIWGSASFSASSQLAKGFASKITARIKADSKKETSTSSNSQEGFNVESLLNL